MLQNNKIRTLLLVKFDVFVIWLHFFILSFRSTLNLINFLLDELFTPYCLLPTPYSLLLTLIPLSGMHQQIHIKLYPLLARVIPYPLKGIIPGIGG